MSGETRGSRCRDCHAPVREGVRFCPECGAPMMGPSELTCPACGVPHRERASFCSQCGAHLASIAEAERRVITVLFADLSGFTRLTERLQPETVHGLVASCLEPLTDCVTRWGGYVDKFIGDCVMALFGAPAAYENEPERALRAAFDMQRALEDWSPDGDIGGELSGDVQPRLAIGINTGAVVTGLFSGGGARDYTAVGDVVNVASRLQSACQPGAILVGEKTYRETHHIFEFGEEQVLAVRGREQPVAARRALRERSERRSVRGFRGRSAPLIDRQEELGRLRDAWSDVPDRSPRTVLVAGPAGIGKSRLVAELISAEGLDVSDVARGRSYPYARRTPWEPISELLWELYGLPSGLEPARAAAALSRQSSLAWTPAETAGLSVALGRSLDEVGELAGQAPADRKDAVTGAVTKALSAPGSEPSLLVLEDLQWADRTTLDFLARSAVGGLSGSHLLVLVARPPLRGEEALADLFQSQLERVELGSLSSEESEELLRALLGEHEFPERFVRRVVARTEGNPLFLEEMVNSLAEREEIRRDEGPWYVVGDPDRLEVPDGVESLLSARMDALPPSTKRVLQCASVVGRRFWSGVLTDELVGRPVQDDLDRLREGGMVHSVPDSRLPGDREYVFDHLLLQEVAYTSLLRGMRAELHGAVAEWLEERSSHRVRQYHDLVAFHWQRSDEPRRAVPALERAAQQARRRGALDEARSTVEKALELAEEPGERARLLGLAEELAADLAETDRRAELIRRLEELGESTVSEKLRTEAAYRRARFDLASGRLDEARAAGKEAVDGFRAEGDLSRLADSFSLLGRVAHLWGDYEEARHYYEASLPLQRETGDQYGEAELLDRLALVRIDVGRFEEALAMISEVRSLCVEIRALSLEARCLAHRADALRSLGMLEEAEEAAREAFRHAEDSGSARARASARFTLAAVLADRGKRQDATALLERVAAFAEERNRPGLAARAYLVRADLEEGQEAIGWAMKARETADRSSLVHVNILALNREAEVRLAAGDLSRAERLSERAQALLEKHGNVQGPEERVYWVRARVLRALDRTEAASEAMERARSVVRQKADWIDDSQTRKRFLERVPLDPSVLPGAAADG